MKYQDAVVALEENNALFTFDAVRKFCNNDFGRDLMTNESYRAQYPEITPYNYLMSNVENEIIGEYNWKRQFSALVRKVIDAARAQLPAVEVQAEIEEIDNEIQTLHAQRKHAYTRFLEADSEILAYREAVLENIIERQDNLWKQRKALAKAAKRSDLSVFI